jgi:hypothetical protein
MKNFFLIPILLITNVLYCQVNVSDDIDVSSFPLIKFSIHNNNPSVLPSSAFKFTELVEGVRVKSDVTEINKIKDSVDYSKEKKCVLVLLELLDHPDRTEQNYTFNQAILESLDSVINKGDEFKIVAFSLKDDKANILKNINANFTDDISLIRNSLLSYDQEENDFTNKAVSDIYGAIIEGVKMLDNFESDYSKSILLLSEERNNTKIINSRANAISLAKEKGLIINTVKYNRSRYHQFSEPTISENTYGSGLVLSKSSGDLKIVNKKKKEEIKEFIKSTLNTIVERSSGINYQVSIKLKNKIQDGKNYVIELKVDDTNQIQKIKYNAPGNWVKAQFQLNVYLASGVLLLLLIVLGYIILYFLKKNKLKEIENKNRITDQKEKEEKQESFIKAQQEELLNIKNQEQKRKQIEEEEVRKQTEEKLITQMLSNGSFPILKYVHSSGSNQFEINNPIMTVGRDNTSNRIYIANNNISRNHFSILFSENQYKVLDNNSTNGIILNGRVVKDSVIKNGDIIEIADLSFTFYQ